ncbi:MAG: hypothetical protein QOG05_5593 [Streptosporangiaceae bacterium]|jgi:hypothetical protein|nr:hypothetical protein [Streptosporangiaceae bacterium]
MTSLGAANDGSGVDIALPVIAGTGPAHAAGPDGMGEDDWAICCSGGGIRSAAYCLGALQSLEKRGVLEKVKWILGVSGGSYIAASRALVAHKLPAGAAPPAYAPGTPEELNLRDNTRYIAPDGATVLAGVLSLILGAMVTFVIATAPVYAVAHAWGWLLRWQGVLVPSGPHSLAAHVTALGWWLPTVIAAGIMLVMFLFWWLTLEPTTRWPRRAHWWMSLKPDDRDRGANRARLLSWAATLVAGLALAMLAAPLAISWLTHSTGSLGTVVHFIGFGSRPSWSLPALAGLIAAITVIARYCQAGLAKWNAVGGPAKVTGKNAAPAKPGLLTQLAGWLRQKLLPWLASAVIVLGGAVLALLWTSGGASAGFTSAQLVQVIAALVIIVLARVAVNVNRLSMHDFYRWRLADAFAVTRQAAEQKNPLEARRLFAEAAATRLSGLPRKAGANGQPGLVICGTANINAAREVPPGRGGFCVTFDPQHVTLHREKGLKQKADRSEALTSDYEALVGHRRCTLFDVSAISGAAISPLMGAATRHAYRLLFTTTNVRLGVWLPHPNVVRDARNHLNRQSARARPAAAHAQRPEDRPSQPEAIQEPWWARRPLLLLLWYLAPHPLWDRTGKADHDLEARLWAHVLERRLRGGRSGALWYRAMQPTLGLLWAEAAGHLSYRDTWMYVTDGGHYENLGLVEALRRGAKYIVVLDASGDKANTWSTLGGAVTLARSDAGVDIELEPTTMTGGGQHLAPGQVVRPWAHGTFTRPGSVPGLPDEGEIWVCKLGWWAGAPWDVRAYAKSHSTYPCDPTLEQLYDAEEFEAYHQLGAAAVLAAADHCTPPLRWSPSSSIPSGIQA